MTSAAAAARDDRKSRRTGMRARLAIPVAALALMAVLGALAANGRPFAGSAESAGAGQPRPVASQAAVPVPTVDRFSAPAAFSEASFQVGLGPRPAGSAKSATLAERLRSQLPNGRFESVPGGLRNVVGHLAGRQPAIVIAAHYDTLDMPGFVGANDGAAGSASVVELARALARSRAPGGRELRFVMFDGEEQPPGTPGGLNDFLRYGLRGSKAYVAAHRREVRQLILLDFVGDRSLSLPREAGSNKDLWASLRKAAKRVGVGRAFPDRKVSRIYDDHYPFTQAGIPAIDIIDFTYPPFHTTGDTLDKISAASLDVVGEAVVELVRRS